MKFRKPRADSTVRRMMLIGLVTFLIGACDSAPSVEDVAAETNTLTTDVTYEYDALNRLTAVRYSNGDVIRYSYDEAGNILSVEMDAAE